MTTTGFVWRRVVAGGLGGTVGALLTHPLDVVRTRLQVWMLPLPLHLPILFVGVCVSIIPPSADDV